MFKNSIVYFLLIILSLILGCSKKLFIDTSEINCSPYSEYKSFEIDGNLYEFNAVEGKANQHIHNNRNSYFYETNYTEPFTEPFIIDNLKQLKLSKKDILRLYNLELFITKPIEESVSSILKGDLVSAIVHFKDNNNKLNVRYYEVLNDSLQERTRLRATVPYISATASYLNFLFLEENGISTNNFIFYKKKDKSFRRVKEKSFEISLVNFKRENGSLPEKYKDIDY